MSDLNHVEPGHEGEAGPGTDEVDAQRLTARERHSDALNLIKNHAITASGVGIVPIPGLDLIALSAVQLNLLRNLSELYGFTLTDELGKKLLTAVLGSYLPLTIATPVASVLKCVPGIGTAAGVVAQSTLAGATTYAIGKLFLEHFETGGTVLDVNPAQMAKNLKKAVEEGKTALKRKGSGAPDAQT